MISPPPTPPPHPPLQTISTSTEEHHLGLQATTNIIIPAPLHPTHDKTPESGIGYHPSSINIYVLQVFRGLCLDLEVPSTATPRRMCNLQTTRGGDSDTKPVFSSIFLFPFNENIYRKQSHTCSRLPLNEKNPLQVQGRVHALIHPTKWSCKWLLLHCL